MGKRLHKVAVTLLAVFLLYSCNKIEKEGQPESVDQSTGKKVTFIELGSVNCIPCKMMQPVMEQLEDNFPREVEIIFYDVWTDEGSPFAVEYNIRVIPTQIFLDDQGNEFFRHEGFFSYEDILEVLKPQGVSE